MKFALSLARIAWVWLFLCTPVWADEVSVRTGISHRNAEVGAPVQLQVEIRGAAQNVPPPEVKVDGLDIDYVGPSSSRQIQIINGQFKNEVQTTHVYQIVAQREGEFTIPALEVDLDGKIYRTEPVALKVQKGSAPTGGDTAQARAFAEIDFPKKTAWVGEAIPVEVRLLVDARIRLEDVTQIPELTGDGFTMQKFPQFEQERESRDGREYNVIVFRTAMTPTKAGELEIGPCEIPFIAQVPRERSRNNRRRSMLDSIFGDDDSFFDPFGGFAERRRYTAKAPVVKLDVKPLPVEGRPKEFAGAVGKFRLEAEGSPAQVKLGDPVTMRMRISGEGNFDRVQAPVLADPTGWQPYDASEQFAADNDLKTKGTKSFEIPVIPEVAHQRMPEFHFAFFDPETGKYVVLKSEPGPLKVFGAPAPAPATPVAPSAPVGAESKLPKPETASGEVAALRSDFGSRRDFAMLWQRPGFWIAQAVLGAVALFMLGARLLQRDPERIRVGGLRRERLAQWQRLLASTDASFFENAARWVQFDTALASGVDPNSVDAVTVRRTRRLDEESFKVVEEVFDERAALLYAGGRGPSAALSPERRQRLLAGLKKIEAA